MLTQQYTLELPSFCTNMANELLIPMPPLQSVTSLKYYDSDNTQQTLVEDTDFRVHTPLEGPAKITRIETESSWPTVYDRIDAVELIFTCGYGDEPSDVPNAIRQAVRLKIGAFWSNRDNSMRADRYQQEAAAERLLFMYQVDDIRVEKVM